MENQRHMHFLKNMLPYQNSKQNWYAKLKSISLQFEFFLLLHQTRNKGMIVSNWN